jgi:hypothetical protein
MATPAASGVPAPPPQFPPGWIFAGSNISQPIPADQLAKAEGMEAGCYVSFGIAVFFVAAR